MHTDPLKIGSHPIIQKLNHDIPEQADCVGALDNSHSGLLSFVA